MVQIISKIVDVTTKREKLEEYRNKKDLLDIETPKEFLIFLLISGGVIAAMSITPAILAPAILLANTKASKGSKKKFGDTFYYLKRKKFIRAGNKKISLTKKGLEIAIQHYVTSEIEKKQQHRKWNGSWWMVIFDIPHDQRKKRNALRHFIKRLGMVQLQKSVWIYPFDCSSELQLIKNFFNLEDEKVRLIVSNNIGDVKKLKKIFKLKV